MELYRHPKESRRVTDANLRIRLDSLNPGQFFACCGLFELLSVEEPGLLCCFALDPHRPRIAHFCIHTASGSASLGRVLWQLRHATAAFPNENLELSIRPAVIAFGDRRLDIDWWLDEFLKDIKSIKCWAGQVTTRRLFADLLPQLDVESTCEDLFDRPASTNSLFGVDPRSAWNTLDLGFSPNEHNVPSTVFPAVEVLAAFGLQYFRPDSRNRSKVRYSLWNEPLPASIARLAFLAPWDGLQCTNLVFEICKRGQSYKYFSFAKRAEKEGTNQ
jgi:CRISPR-associated protein Csx14